MPITLGSSRVVFDYRLSMREGYPLAIEGKISEDATSRFNLDGSAYATRFVLQEPSVYAVFRARAMMYPTTRTQPGILWVCLMSFEDQVR